MRERGGRQKEEDRRNRLRKGEKYGKKRRIGEKRGFEDEEYGGVEGYLREREGRQKEED